MPEHGVGVVEAKRNGGLDLLKTAVSVSDTGKRTKSSARQRFFSFPRCGDRCFLLIYHKHKLQMSEVPLISTEKQAELLQRSDISKISLRNGEKGGVAHVAPPIPYGYSIARICSIRDCFFCLRIVQTDKISSIPNNTRMNSPISKTGNL